ncbi:MAG: hypothetical protein ACKOAU_04880 [Pirellula sp.]
MSTGRLVEELLGEYSVAKVDSLHRILSHVRSRGVAFDLERSVRAEASGVYTKRLLISFDGEDFRAAFSSDLFAPLGWMGASSIHMQRLIVFFPKAWRIHFGWELGVQGWIGKIYLEMRPRVSTSDDKEASARFEPDQLLFLGYKWLLSTQGQGVVSKYKIHTHLPASETLDRWREILVRGNGGREHDAIGRLVERLKLSGTFDMDLLLLEVSDEGSSRLSYDINLYDLELDVGAVSDHLLELTRNAFSGAVQRQWSDHLSAIAHERLGHLATGQDRNGSLFWTLYYGAVRVITHSHE